MSTMRKFLKYFLLFLAVYFLSNIAIVYLMKTTYNPKRFEIDPNVSPKVEITDFQATITNGYVTGKITNDTGEDINGKYLKLDYYSKNGTNVGTKYVEINNLKPGETMDFTSQFNFDNVDSLKATIVDEKEMPKNKKLIDFSLDKLTDDVFHAPWYVWVAALVLIA